MIRVYSEGTAFSRAFADCQGSARPIVSMKRWTYGEYALSSFLHFAPVGPCPGITWTMQQAKNVSPKRSISSRSLTALKV